jgi:hypothetical protein
MDIVAKGSANSIRGHGALKGNLICPSQIPDIGESARSGSHHYRAFIGDTQTYDIFAHMQFTLMTLLGLR